MILLSATLGYPRMGEFRELKKAVEAYWKKEISQDELNQTAQELRKEIGNIKKAGISHIPSNDFSFYDQILDLSCTVGNVPRRFNFTGDQVDLDTYFMVARGNTADLNNNQCAG